MRKSLLIVLLNLTTCAVIAQTESWAAWEVEADTLLSHQDFKKAIELYTKVIGATKTTDIVHFKSIYKRAVCYYSLQDFPKSLEDLDVFIPQYPSSPQAHILRALVYREMGDPDRQLEDVEAAISLQPDPSLVKWRATLLLDKGKLKEAKEDLLAVKQVQDDPELEAQLGYIYNSENQLDSALLSINKAIELEPSYLPAYYYAGSFCLQGEQYELALKYLNVGLKLEPGNSTILFYKGVALIELDRKDVGCRFLKKAFDAGEDDAGDYLKEYCYDANNK